MGSRLSLSALLLLSVPSWGSGFALIERDAAGLGRAYAGQVAVVEAGSLGFNPAALPQRLTLSASLHGIHNGLQPEDAGVDALIPAAYGAYRGLGVGIYAPFGLATDYPHDWSGRRAALYSGIESARFQVAGGVQVSPTVRFGAGIFTQRLWAKLSKAYPLALGADDAEVSIEGEGSGFGWSVGGLWTPDPGLSVGLAYASHVEHRLRGHAELPTGRVKSRADLTTPESLTAGLSWTVRPGWRLLGGVTWTRWSRLQSLDIELSNGLALSEVHRWRDTWRLDLGGEFERGAWTWRLGAAWDQSPIRSSEYRTPRLPDADRVWGTLGVGYQRADWRIDLGYAHLWFGDRKGTHLQVKYSGGSQILAVGISRQW